MVGAWASVVFTPSPPKKLKCAASIEQHCFRACGPLPGWVILEDFSTLVSPVIQYGGCDLPPRIIVRSRGGKWAWYSGGTTVSAQ